MSEEDYYVKVMVDGKAVPDDDLCRGNPTSNNCRHKVSGMINETPGNNGYNKAK